MELKTLIAECTAYDFKVMLEEKKPKSWLKSVSALANGLGGSLFYGMTTIIITHANIFASVSLKTASNILNNSNSCKYFCVSWVNF